MEEKKNNKGLIGVIIVLIVLVLGLVGFIVYDKVLKDDKMTNNENTITKTNKEEVDKKLTEEELENYLNYVPLSQLGKDAYSGENMNLNTIDKISLLFNSNRETEKNLNDKSQYFGCVKEQDFNTKIKQMYNMDINNFKSEVKDNETWIESYLILKDEYYCELGYGGHKYKSKNSNVSYDIDENNLIITEQVGIINEAGGHVTVYNGKNIIKEYSSDNLIEDNTNYEEVAEEYVKNNIEEFNTYKHTFKQHKDGTYYWYSTELANK